MIIRSASLKNVPSIVKVHVSSLKSSHRDILPVEFLDRLDDDYSTGRFINALTRNDEKIFVAQDRKAWLVGFIWGGLARGQGFKYKGENYAKFQSF
ncbi:hypothetical protein [Gracilibacillus xinjiangensis]|uniref:GNAT family N-acetyltransferase n=1 Tax=Gracilibacillus xinjiangensis TaxID=1193282 RepID=A0ABV8WVB6_9BACI